MAAADLVGLLLGDLLDVDAADRREDHHRLLPDPVPDDAGVELLRDVGLRIDQDAARHLAVDLQLQDVGGVRLRLVGRVGELHAAGLHPAAGQHLRLDHGRPGDALGDRPRLLRIGGEPVVRNGDSGASDDLARLVLVEPHLTCLSA